MNSNLRYPAIGLLVSAVTWVAALSLLTLLNAAGFHTAQGLHVSDNELFNVLGLVPLWGWYGVIIAGAIHMLRGGRGGLAYAAASLAVIPCCSPWVALGMPFGIWALINLRTTSNPQG